MSGEHSQLFQIEQEESEEVEDFTGTVDLLLSKYFIKIEDGDDGGKCRFCKKPKTILYVKNGHSNLVKHLKVTK
jgi:hypothetical protein